jgi:preprotein translocase subunit SecG
MYTFFVIVHVIVSLILCVVVLLQSSKGSGLAGAFGGGGGLPQQIFGSRGMSTLLNKLTIYFAAAFFVTSAVLFGLSARRGPTATHSIVREAAEKGRLPAAVPPPPSDAGSPVAPLGGDNPAGGTPPAQPAGQGQSPQGGK